MQSKLVNLFLILPILLIAHNTALGCQPRTGEENLPKAVAAKLEELRRQNPDKVYVIHRQSAWEKKIDNIIGSITLGRFILGVGIVGLAYAGLYHYGSKTAPFYKDRFVCEEIRNLILKGAIPLTCLGGVITLVENHFKNSCHKKA